MSQLEEILSGVSGAKVVAYSSLALDKVVLLVLFLLKRMDSGPSKTGLQAGFIFGKNIVWCHLIFKPTFEGGI